MGNVWVLWAWSPEDGVSPTDYPEHGMTSDQDFGGVLINLFACDFIFPHNGFFLQNAGQGLAFTLAVIILICALIYWINKAVGKPPTRKPSDIPESAGIQRDDTELENHQTSTSCGKSVANFFGKRVAGMWAISGLTISLLYMFLNCTWTVVWVVYWPESGYKPPNIGENIARVLGNMLSANMLITVLPATRNSILWLLMGASFERTISFHRWLGRWTFALLCGHAVIFSINRGIGVIWDDMTNSLVTAQAFGCAAFICLLGLVVFSVDAIRRHLFNLFYFSHLLFLLGGFILASLHNEKFLPFAYTAAILWGVDRFFRLLWGTVPKKATEVVLLADGTTFFFFFIQ